MTNVRYKNIWPYDFSRVRLETPTDDDSDYINASFVQPRGTSRRYIATQGPLDATYRDFWTLVWEQNVRVIVMYVINPEMRFSLTSPGSRSNTRAVFSSVATTGETSNTARSVYTSSVRLEARITSSSRPQVSILAWQL